jgi:hypothetical protein
MKERIYWFTNVRGRVLNIEQEAALQPGEIFKECINCPET